AKVSWGRRHGVRIAGRPPLAADFQSFAQWQPAADAAVLLCTKCYDNPAVLGRLPASVTLLPIQNGFDPLLDDRAAHPEGIASFVSECIPHQAHTRITRPGRLHLGSRRPSGPPPPLLAFLADRLRQAPFRVTVVPDILPYKYTK